MNDESHFNKLFYYCVIMSLIGITFLILLCYLPIPKGSQDFAENVQGYIEGSVVTAAISFLLGGNLPSKKAAGNPTVTGDNPQVTVNQQPDPSPTATVPPTNPPATS